MVETRTFKYYILYKTTNIVDGMYYIGVHRTNVLKDYYIGSGTRLLNAVRKHGRKRFKREILAFFDNDVDMYEAEALAVDYKDPMCYNLGPGGIGGPAVGGWKRTESEKKRIGDANRGRLHTAEARAKMSVIHKGKVTSEETKTNMRITAFERHVANVYEYPTGVLANMSNEQREAHEQKRDDKFRDNLPDITGSYHFPYDEDDPHSVPNLLPRTFLKMDTSLSSHLNESAQARRA